MTTRAEFTPGQVDAFNAYLTDIRDRLGLSHWDVYLAAEEPESDDVHASIEPTDGRFVAPVRLARDWFDRSPRDQRNDVVHELLHLTHRDLTDHVRLTILTSGYIPAAAYDSLWNPARLAAEQMVDHLAAVLSPMVPEPDFTAEVPDDDA